MKKILSIFVFLIALTTFSVYADEKTEQYQKACNKGDAKSCNALGLIYHDQGYIPKLSLYITKR